MPDAKPPVVRTKESIRQLVLTNDLAVERAVVAIHRRQTAGERAQKATLKQNGVGFNSADAPALSRYADNIHRHGGLLPKALADARQRILKYAGQLLEIAQERELQKFINPPSNINHKGT